MFAVIRTGGKQYRVAKDDLIVVERLTAEPGSVVALDDVLMIGEAGRAPTIGAPKIDNAAVFAEVVVQRRGDKIIVFKKKRRHNYRRKRGHRQYQTVLRVLAVSPTGERPVLPEAVPAPEPQAPTAAPASEKAAAKRKAAKAAKVPRAARPKATPKARAKPKALGANDRE